MLAPTPNYRYYCQRPRPLASINCEPRQVRKEATVVVTLSAGVRRGH